MKIIIENENLKINMKIIDDPDSKEKAIVTIALGPFKIKGFRIREGEYMTNKEGSKLWLTPPAYRSRTGKFHKEFWCEDKVLWKEIEEKILAKYNEELMNKEIKKDNIPIIEK